MSTIARTLIVVEVMICFGPMSLVLLLGLVIAPMQLQFLFTLEGEGRLGSLILLASVGAGMAGLVALTNVLLWILGPSSTFLGRRWTWLGILLGILPISMYAFGPVDSIGWRVAGVLPLVCTLHLSYLARAFLFSGQKAGVNPERMR